MSRGAAVRRKVELEDRRRARSVRRVQSGDRIPPTHHSGLVYDLVVPFRFGGWAVRRCRNSTSKTVNILLHCSRHRGAVRTTQSSILERHNGVLSCTQLLLNQCLSRPRQSRHDSTPRAGDALRQRSAEGSAVARAAARRV